MQCESAESCYILSVLEPERLAHVYIVSHTEEFNECYKCLMLSRVFICKSFVKKNPMSMVPCKRTMNRTVRK